MGKNALRNRAVIRHRVSLGEDDPITALSQALLHQLSSRRQLSSLASSHDLLFDRLHLALGRQRSPRLYISMPARVIPMGSNRRRRRGRSLHRPARISSLDHHPKSNPQRGHACCAPSRDLGPRGRGSPEDRFDWSLFDGSHVSPPPFQISIYPFSV